MAEKELSLEERMFMAGISLEILTDDNLSRLEPQTELSRDEAKKEYFNLGLIVHKSLDYFRDFAEIKPGKDKTKLIKRLVQTKMGARGIHEYIELVFREAEEEYENFLTTVNKLEVLQPWSIQMKNIIEKTGIQITDYHDRGNERYRQLEKYLNSLLKQG